MTETTAETSEPTTVPEPREQHRSHRLYQAAAWVAIVAGTLFIVGAIFFTGFILGRHSGPGWGGPGWGMGGPRHHGGVMMPRPPMGDRDDDMGPGMMGPGMMGPGMMGPGMMGPGMMGPGNAGPGMMTPGGPGMRGPNGPTTSSPAPPPGR